MNSISTLKEVNQSFHQQNKQKSIHVLLILSWVTSIKTSCPFQLISEKELDHLQTTHESFQCKINQGKNATIYNDIEFFFVSDILSNT